MLPERILSIGRAVSARRARGVVRLDADVRRGDGPEGSSARSTPRGRAAGGSAPDAAVRCCPTAPSTPARAPLPGCALVGRLHDAIVKAGLRHKVGLVADAAVWDITTRRCWCRWAPTPWPLAGLPHARGARGNAYLKGLRGGFVEAMSMMGVTPASAYCGAKLVEASASTRRGAHGVPGRGAPPRRHRSRAARPRMALLPRRGVPGRSEGRPRRHGRVPLQERGAPSRQQPGRRAHAARRLGLRGARQGRLRARTRLRRATRTP